MIEDKETRKETSVSFQHLASERMFEWYGRDMPLVHDSPTFRQFALRTYELSHMVDNKSIKLRVDPAAATAYTDGDTAFLPGTYFHPRFFQEEMDVAEEDVVGCAVACINGSQIHEALHIKHSPKNIVEMASLVGMNEDYCKKNPGFTGLLQLSEDLFIEEWARKNRSYLSEFLEGKNDVLFTPEQLKSFVDKLEDTTQSGGDQSDLLNAIAHVKNSRLADDPSLSPWQNIVDTINEARDAELSLAPKRRAEIALATWKLIQKAKDAAGNAIPQPQVGEGQLQGIGLGKEVDKSDFEGEKAAGFVEDMPGNEEKKLQEIAQQINQEFEKIEHEQQMITTESHLGGIPEEVIVNVIERHQSGRHLEPNSAFYKMGQMLRYMREVKHVPGQPRDRGTKILTARLARIAVDQHVLGYPDTDRMKRGRPEVIFLIDFSGSMGSMAYTVSQAAMAAHLSLMEARVPVATYAHTSEELHSSDTPHVYAVAAFQMPFCGRSVPVTHSKADVLDRFDRLVGIEKQNNFDGVAIAYCSKQYSRQEGSKFLFVLSDGQPHGGYAYGGELARQHTKNAIQEARKRGVDVYSLSLTSSVMDNNNYIYGKENNIAAYDNHFEKAMMEVVRRAGMEKH